MTAFLKDLAIATGQVLIIVVMTALVICALVACERTGCCQTAGLVLDRTQSLEFKQAFIDYANSDLDGLADLVFLTAAGAAIPSNTATTVTVNQAQSNRWFKPTKGSFYSDSTWAMGQSAIKRKTYPRAAVASSAISQATDRINNATVRARFLSRLSYLKNPTTE